MQGFNSSSIDRSICPGTSLSGDFCEGFAGISHVEY